MNTHCNCDKTQITHGNEFHYGCHIVDVDTCLICAAAGTLQLTRQPHDSCIQRITICNTCSGKYADKELIAVSRNCVLIDCSINVLKIPRSSGGVSDGHFPGGFAEFVMNDQILAPNAVLCCVYMPPAAGTSSQGLVKKVPLDQLKLANPEATFTVVVPSLYKKEVHDYFNSK